MPKHEALIAFGLLTQRREDATPKHRPRRDLRAEETARVMPATGSTYRGPSPAEQSSLRGGVRQAVPTKEVDTNVKGSTWIRRASPKST